MPAKTERVQFSIYLPPELVRALKHRAVDEGRSLSAITEDAVRRYLEED